MSVAIVALGRLATSCSNSTPRALLESTASTSQALTVRAVCLEPGPDSGDLWTCGEELTVECREQASPGTVETLHVDVADCPAALTVNSGPYGVGTHQIEVFAPSAQHHAGSQPAATICGAGSTLPDATSCAPDAGVPICSARLTIVDTTPPHVVSHDQELWPPNHAMHQVTVADCVTVTDACDAIADVQFLWATVDEAPDARGSGNTAPDLAFIDCHTVGVRAERQGGGDGRVYELGYRATDQSGNSVDGTCRVAVPHDQGKGHTATGVAIMRVEAPAGCVI
jgi:hypothetical protein